VSLHVKCRVAIGSENMECSLVGKKECALDATLGRGGNVLKHPRIRKNKKEDCASVLALGKGESWKRKCVELSSH
jgi:hypothetical protein